MLVGVVGFAGSGKGAVSDIFVEMGFTKLAFADPVKDCVSKIFGWNRASLEGDTDTSRRFREIEDPYWGITPRYALQLMGTEAGRSVFGGDIWIRSMEVRMKSYPDCVISDVRFPNEMEFIRSNGGNLVTVSRGNLPVWYETARVENHLQENLVEHGNLMSTKYPEIHYSEWAWIGQPVDFMIDNNSDLDTLRNNVIEMTKSFKGTRRHLPFDKEI